MEYEKLKNILCTEIDETIESIMKEGKMSMSDLEVLDKLTHSLKSVITTMAMEENGYSYNNSGARGRGGMGRYAYEGGNSGRYYEGGNSGRYYEGGNSGRYYDGGGYSGRRYYEGGYSGRRNSRDEGKSYMIQQFEKLMSDVSSQEEQEVLQSAINRLKNM